MRFRIDKYIKEIYNNITETQNMGGDSMFDHKKFKAELIIKGKNMKDVANMLGINEATLYRKINGNSDFYRREIQLICDYLDIEDPSNIFFGL